MTRTPSGQWRSQKIRVELEEPVKPTEPLAVLLIDLAYPLLDPRIRTRNAA